MSLALSAKGEGKTEVNKYHYIFKQSLTYL